VTTYDAILPAGGHIDPDFAQVVGTSAKALIRFGDQTILERLIHALQQTGRVGRIVAIGGTDVQDKARSMGAEALAEGTSGPENILKGLRHLLAANDPPEKVLVVTADLPFVQVEHLVALLDLFPEDQEICVPIVRKADYQRRFPNSKSTYVPLADDQWTMGGAFLVDVIALQRSMPQIEKVFAQRKSVFGMAKLLGPVFLIKFIRKRLTVPDIEGKIRAMLGVTGTAVMGAPPELAYDIDALDDYEYAMEMGV
jgi:GTP:adenosylcobinamide-phosphate guanylyltransferase